MPHNANAHDPSTIAPGMMPLLVLRSVIGGMLMGLANLVPGISGGTMLLASGVYPRFIQAIADITRLRFRFASMLVLGVVVLAALAAIVGLAGPVGQLVISHTWIAYSVFIGLTLGGVPVVWKLIGQADARVWIAAAAGFVAMATLAFVQATGLGAGGGGEPDWSLMLLAGIAGASAMILPGISGGYLLLVLGVYVAILDAISRFKDALQVRDITAAMDPAVSVVLPVGLGVVLGVVVVSNALKWVLNRYEKATLGVLLGLLLGAVAGLWPFQQFVEPPVGSMLKNQQVVLVEDQLTYEQTGKPVEPKDYPMQYFSPTVGQVAASAGLIVLGFAATAVISMLGRDKPR